MPDDLLTEEELLALEEELLAAEQPPEQIPVGEPPRFTPMAPRILPPGPSPEFLRRSQLAMPNESLPPATQGWGRGAIESYDPATGQRRNFETISQPQPGPDYMEQLRQQINATEYKTQAEALNAAIQFQHMREFQRLVNAGVPTERALLMTGAGMFGKNPNVIAPLINATRPVPQATMRDLGNGVRVVEGGRNTRIVPRSALPEAQFTPEVRELDGERVIRLGPNRWQYLGGVFSKNNAPPSVLASIYKAEIEEAQKALDLLPKSKTKKREPFEKQIEQARKDRSALIGRPAPKQEETIQTSPQSPATPVTKAQYDALPSGGYYIDPNTKAVKRKK
jgi:hypothetical protein